MKVKLYQDYDYRFQMLTEGNVNNQTRMLLSLKSTLMAICGSLGVCRVFWTSAVVQQEPVPANLGEVYQSGRCPFRD